MLSEKQLALNERLLRNSAAWGLQAKRESERSGVPREVVWRRIAESRGFVFPKVPEFYDV